MYFTGSAPDPELIIFLCYNLLSLLGFVGKGILGVSVRNGDGEAVSFFMK